MHSYWDDHGAYDNIDIYTFPTAPVYKAMNGDSKLLLLRKATRQLRSKFGDDNRHPRCTFTFNDSASSNSGEDWLFIREEKLRDVVEEEVNRLEAIKTARAGLGKKFL